MTKMIINADDLRQLIEYLDKEMVEQVDVIVISSSFSVHVDFKDQENRECTVIMYDAMRKMKPDIVKKMQLNSRLKRIKPLEDK